MFTEQKPTSVGEFASLVGRLKDRPGFKPPKWFGLGHIGGKDPSYLVMNGPGQNTGAAVILMVVLGVIPGSGVVQNVPMTSSQISEALEFFRPFLDDKKVHVNIEALQKMEKEGGDWVATFIF
jgi:hypothetical protein